MPLVPLQLPPGVYRNGTDMQSPGRWRDASLVRWVEGTMRPVGGFEERLDAATTTAPRAALAWSDLGGDSRIAIGTADGLYSISASGVVTDITPSGLTAGDEDAAVNTGYGGGFYGLGFYGTERADTGNYGEATTWALDNWGENLLACSVADGVIYEWDLNVANDGVAVTNAPVDNASMMVTDERFVFALAAGGNPRAVAWCDREDNTTWTPATTNEAGDIELQTSGRIMCGVRARGQALILTDQDAHSATYQGPPFVYGFERVGTSCGIVSRKAVAVVDAGAFWMGARSFFVYAGGSVEAIPCDVSDYVFADINRAQQSKVFAVANAQFGEVWFFYPSGSSNENDRYVVYSYKEGHWSIGTLGRTCAVDRGVFRRPIWFTSAGVAYNHEVGVNYGDAEIFAESGPIYIGNGDQVAIATKLIPDEKTQGDTRVLFKTRFHPNDTEREYGPYSMSNPTSVRFTGRQVRMRIEGVNLADWRVGVPRLEVTAGGSR